MAPTSHQIFKAGSTTYYYSSLFFPSAIRNDVVTLYAFVRTADDLVDQVPPDRQGFLNFRRAAELALSHRIVNQPVIDNFIALSRRKTFDPNWMLAFLNSMEADLTKTEYQNFAELEEYIRGSAEVIGQYLCQIMNLTPVAWPAARAQGKAMQLINFIRDIQEDLDLGRTYLPQNELTAFNLPDLRFTTVSRRTEQFRAFIQQQLDRYHHCQFIAEQGYKYIPKRYLTPIKTAAEMYNWTAREIARNPLIIYKRKIKPNRYRVIATIIKNFFS